MAGFDYSSSASSGGLPDSIDSAAESDTILGARVTSDPADTEDRWAVRADGREVFATAATTLAANSSIGDSSISTNDPVPAGAVIKVGSETRPVDSCTGNGPFTVALGGGTLASGHTSGDTVSITMPVGSFGVVLKHLYDDGVDPVLDLGWVPMLHTRMTVLTEGMVWSHGTGAHDAGFGGFVGYSGSVDAVPFCVIGRNGEEITMGVTPADGNFFDDALKGDTVIRAFLSRILLGTSNGDNTRNAAMIVDQSRSIKMNVAPEFTGTAQGTPPANATGAVAKWVTVVIDGAYYQIPAFAVTGAPAVPSHTPLTGPAGATVANGSLATRSGMAPTWGRVYDSFSSGANLSGRTADSGQAWSTLSGSWTVSSGTAKLASGTPGMAVIDAQVPYGLLTCDVTSSPTSMNVGLCFAVVDANNFLMLFIERTSGGAMAWEIGKWAGGSFTSLVGSGATTTALNTLYTPHIHWDGKDIKVTGGPSGRTLLTWSLSAADQATFRDATKVGLWGYFGATQEDGSTTFDNFDFLASY